MSECCNSEINKKEYSQCKIHGAYIGTCKPCFQNAVSKMESDIERLQTENKQLKEKASKLEKCLLEIKQKTYGRESMKHLYLIIEVLFRDLHLD